MLQQVVERVSQLQNHGLAPLLRGSQIGLEKESLRVNEEGSISQQPHPAALGSALTNPYITTDYSEALLEFITPPFTSSLDALTFLEDTQRFVYSQLEKETLWATSMPCVVAGESSIPLARYGSSNTGTMKTVYRRGLGYRYGRVMQVIAGVHFNYSFSDEFWCQYQQLKQDQSPLRDFISESYFSLTRNLLRMGWLVPYLFGASPAVCKSFLGGKKSTLHEFDEYTYYEPYATSLRMGDIGYQNNKENETGVNVKYDNLASYVSSLTSAIETPCPEYEKIGVVVDGVYRQLNANILQIENEYYSTVRPKPILDSNEKPSLALKRRGVRYIELRSLDVNAFDPLGISERQLRFLEALMLLCLLLDSPPVTAQEKQEIDRNEMRTAHRGREPQLRLVCQGRERPLAEWALDICTAMEPVCNLLDSNVNGTPYREALLLQRDKVNDPGRTPSARMLAEMRNTGESFYHFAKRMSQEHYDYFMAKQLPSERIDSFLQAAAASLQRQKEIEQSDAISFSEFLAQYFAQK